MRHLIPVHIKPNYNQIQRTLFFWSEWYKIHNHELERGMLFSLGNMVTKLAEELSYPEYIEPSIIV